MFPAGLQGFMTGLDGNIPLANLLEKLPNSVCPGDENCSLPAAPGVPVTLHGIVCHEIGGRSGTQCSWFLWPVIWSFDDWLKDNNSHHTWTLFQLEFESSYKS